MRQNVLKKGSRRNRVVSVVMAGILAFGLTPLPAFAVEGLQAGSADLTAQEDEQPMDTTTGVIGTAFAAANNAPDFLGLNNPEKRDSDNYDSKIYFFGTDRNENPDPFMWNLRIGAGTGVTAAKRTGPGPAASLDTWDANDTNKALWELMPDVIIGTGANKGAADGDPDHYIDNGAAAAVETNLGLAAGSYKPKAVVYDFSNLNTMMAIMYEIAKDADAAVEANPEKTLRYGSALEIARDYERYIIGMKGYVKQKIDDGTVPMRTVACIQSYADGSYNINVAGYQEGTASTNRFLEAVQGVAENYAATCGRAPDDNGVVTVTKDELLENVDLIICGGHSQTAADFATIKDQLAEDGLLEKCWYATNTSAGATFALFANSVDNAFNVGRVLPCLYPEILDQSDMIAYYYDTFYHLKDGAIAPAVDERMDGVRNWAVAGNNDASESSTQAMTAWSEEDVSDYNHAETQALLENGIAYLNVQAADEDVEIPETLEPSANVADDEMDFATVSVTAPNQVFTGEPIQPKVTVKFGEYILEEGTDYEVVSYENNINFGTATVTVKGKGDYEGTATGSFEIVDAEVSVFAGSDRYDTASMIAEATAQLPGASYDGVVVVTGENFPDALSGTGLAGAMGYPIVVLNGTAFDDSAKASLDAIASTNASGKLDVLVVGGEAVIYPAVVDELKAWDADEEVVRVAGDDRYATNAAVYAYGAENGEWATNVAFLATGKNFPDALAIAPYLAANASPVILIDPDGALTDDAKAAVAPVDEVVALGGEAVVPEDLLADAAAASAGKKTDRLGGEGRYQTGAKIVAWELAWGMSLEGAGVATGDNFPDALASGFLLGKSNAVLCLMSPNLDDNADMVVLMEHAVAPTTVNVFGGANAVPEKVYNQIAAAFGWTGYGIDDKGAPDNR